jgi:hypothetical protein
LTAADYRHKFEKLTKLMSFPVGKYFITASIPERLIPVLLTNLHLPLDTRIIRAPSDQPQVSYNIIRYSTQTTTTLRLAIDVAKAVTPFLGDNRIGILFACTIAEVQEIDAKFTHCSWYSKLSDERRYDNMTRWKSGQAQWMAATTGLLQGIDLRNVGAAIFIGNPYGFINIYQGSGRLGRDGTPSWSIMLSPDYATSSKKKDAYPDQDLKCNQEASEWVQDQCCRRLKFSKTFDGTLTSCADLPGCHLCDFCDPNSDLLEAIQPIINDPVSVPSNPSHSADTDEYDTFDFDWSAVPYTTSPQHTISHTRSIAPAKSSSSLILPAKTSSSSTGSIRPVKSTSSHTHSVSSVPSSSSLTRFGRTSVAPPAHLVPPTSNAPSVAIQAQVAYLNLATASKNESSTFLNHFTAMLADKCVVCYAHTGELHPDHTAKWVKCKPNNGRFYPDVKAWVNFKTLINYPTRHLYCYYCGLPQQDFLPPSHGPFDPQSKARKKCRHEDFVVLILWFIKSTPIWWERAVAFFETPGTPNSITADMALPAFAEWTVAGESLSRFNNGIMMILWFFNEHQKQMQ